MDVRNKMGTPFLRNVVLTKIMLREIGGGVDQLVEVFVQELRSMARLASQEASFKSRDKLQTRGPIDLPVFRT